MQLGIIYKYTCNETGKSYIGQTINPEARNQSHYHDIKGGTTTLFAKAVTEYGWRNFEYEILWCGDALKLDMMECDYIDKFDTYRNGYNSTQGNRSKPKTCKVKCKPSNNIVFKDGLPENLDDYIMSIEAEILIKALKLSGGNQTKAADLLGITFRVIRYKIEKYSLREQII